MIKIDVMYTYIWGVRVGGALDGGLPNVQLHF